MAAFERVIATQETPSNINTIGRTVRTQLGCSSRLTSQVAQSLLKGGRCLDSQGQQVVRFAAPVTSLTSNPLSTAFHTNQEARQESTAEPKTVGRRLLAHILRR